MLFTQIKKGLLFVVLTTFLIIISCERSIASHLRAGEIIVERVDCQSLTFKITITVYTNTGSPILFGGSQDVLDFGDGTQMLVPETPNTPRPDLGENIGTASFTEYHTYSGASKYLISYTEPNRNEGVLNMQNSLFTLFYIETFIDIDPFKGCNNTPKLLIPPIDKACPGVAFFHNPGAYDPDGDSLSYEMVVPFSNPSVPVVNYRDPNDQSFYTNYPTANEEGNDEPTFSIDPVTGTIKWDSPSRSSIGEYNIAFVVKEWRKIMGVWYLIGFVRRDMQIVTEDCINERPDLEIPQDTCIEAGTQLRATIFGIDPENHEVKIEAFSEIFNFASAQSPATFTPHPPGYQPSNPPAELDFEWNTVCGHVKTQPYQVVFKITDKPPNGPKLVTFKTWNITVVAPAPEWNSAVIDLATRSTELEWDAYTCSNASTMQIWRRVDSFVYDPENCETGMPEFMGYTLIDEVNISNNPVTSYTDNNGGKGLAPGAKYCYRLVAVFPLPKGGKSYMSDEICVDPIEADAPVITNVTVDKTGVGDGEITVKWLDPFDVNQAQFPPPYTYEVWRGAGFTGTPTTKIHTGRITALTTTDVGLNTEVEPYNYYVIAFDANDVVVDTSAVASSVWVDANPGLDNIKLTWNALVPWSNSIQSHPLHLIYRSTTGSSEADMTLIDNVDVNANGFVYVDEGQWNGVPLATDVNYCYRVLTRGGYGNPQIGEPLENFSQIVCTPLDDEKPPCKPEPPIPNDPPQCDDPEDALNFPCDQDTFSNQINWNRPTGAGCLNDVVVYYNIYVSAVKGGVFVLHQTNVRDTFYIDANLPSYARCYKIQAVDRSGNASELSDEICIDNCPYYELPNVFSPNGDGCNDTFSAYSDRPKGGDGSGSDCVISEDDKKRCPRFVSSVHFKVYNRWGKEVYSYQSGGERLIYIDWDGRGKNGKELSTGAYYYVADIKFYSVDPAKSEKTLKGWIQLLR